MVQHLGQNTAFTYGEPPRQLSAALAGGALRVLSERITLASQASGDTVILGPLPAGAVVHYGMVTSSRSLGSSTLSIGTAAEPGKYRDGGTFTAIDRPNTFGRIAALGVKLPEAEDVLLTIGAAALPSSGEIAISIFYSTDQ